MTDKQLEERAGLNVGVEPDSRFFIDKAGASYKTLSGQVGSEVILVEGDPNGNIRTLFALEEPEVVTFNPDPTNAVAAMLRFRNQFGETITTPARTVSAGGFSAIAFGPEIFNFILQLVKGEKISAVRGAPDENVPGTGPVELWTTFFDAKHKPKPQGGGGLSDGNVVAVRETVTSQGVEVGPPPGKAWRPLPLPTENGTGFISLGHFGLVGDVVAQVRTSLVLPDSSARLFGAVNIDPQTINPGADGELFFAIGSLIPHPFKIRYSLDAPAPVGRVLLLGAYVEYDLPKDHPEF